MRKKEEQVNSKKIKVKYQELKEGLGNLITKIECSNVVKQSNNA
jgi:hypothetical protein